MRIRSFRAGERRRKILNVLRGLLAGATAASTASLAVAAPPARPATAAVRAQTAEARPSDALVPSRTWRDLAPPTEATFKFGAPTSSMSIASADFDEDGVRDIAVGFARGRASRTAIYRGNVDAIYPNTPEARRRRAEGTFVDAPFLPEPRPLEEAVPPDFLAAGDFDADGHADIALASRGEDILWVSPGDGRGGFRAPKKIDLPGRVTALAGGELDRRDGLADLAVALEGDGGPRLLIFRDAHGAASATPETITLSERATEIAICAVEGDARPGVAVAAGRSLVLVAGRALGDEAPRAVRRTDFERPIASLAAGDFGGASYEQLAVLLDDGDVRVASVEGAGKSASLRAESVAEPISGASRLIAAKVSTGRGDDVVALGASGLTALAATGDGARRTAAAIDGAGAVLAVLPMRLNSDGLDDLVVLREGSAAPAVALSAASATVAVTNTNNAGIGSLRQAILNANATPGLDEITFAIPGSGPFSIKPISELPAITDAVLVDGTTQPGFAGAPIVEIDGSLTRLADGLTVKGATSTCVVRGLAINRFEFVAVLLQDDVDNVTVEGNYLGTDVTGLAEAPNGDGVFSASSGDLVVGGEVPAARNVIGGNEHQISGNGWRDVQILGNYLGVDATGAAALDAIGDNPDVDVIRDTIFDVSSQSGTTQIGALVPGARNVIAGRVEFVKDARDGVIQNNFIGTNAAGTVSVGKTGALFLAEGEFVVGGASPVARNVISGLAAPPDTLAAVNFSGVFGSTFVGNFVGTDATGRAPIPNALAGVAVVAEDDNNGSSRDVEVADNVVAFNAGAGVIVTGASGLALVRENAIYANGGLGIDLGDDGVTPNDAGDADEGPNGMQNAPALATAELTGGQTVVAGALDSLPSTDFEIDVFASAECDPSGSGEGETFLGTVAVTTDATGHAVFQAALPPAAFGSQITATATRARAGTSELSSCVALVGTAPVDADVWASASAAPATVAAGGQVTYTIVVANAGPAAAESVSAMLSLPDGAAVVGCAATGGGVCGGTPTAPGVLYGSLAAGASETVTFVVSVGCALAGGTFEAGVAAGSLATPDPNPANDTVAVQVTVAAVAHVSIACPADVTVAGSVGPDGSVGAVVDYPSPVASGGCSDATVSCSPASGSTFPLGTTTVTCTATDGVATSSCSFAVTVTAPATPLVCIVDDKTGDRFSIVVDRNSPAFGSWVYVVAANGRKIEGVATTVSVGEHGVVAIQGDERDPVMLVAVDVTSNTGKAKVTERGAKSRTRVVRDRTIGGGC